MRIAVIMSGFPRRSETFALNELLALDAAGALAAVFATKPGDGSEQPGVARLTSKVHMLSPGTPADQAAQVTDALEDTPVTGIHAYFAHVPAEVASIAADRIGRPWGFSTHARDARKVSEDDLLDRARRAACVVACNADVVHHVAAAGRHVTLLPHGVDLTRFIPRGEPSDTGQLRVLAVGRLVAKKGFATLIDAAALARSDWSVRLVGDGPLRDELVSRVAAAGCGDRVTLVGPMTHDQLPDEYAGAHVVAVPSQVNAEGDRDGLPNVVLEAMATGRPVVASDVGAVAAAIDDDVTGLLVPAGDPAALAAAIDRLADDAALRARLGSAARDRVERDYELGGCTDRFISLLESVYV